MPEGGAAGGSEAAGAVTALNAVGPGAVNAADTGTAGGWEAAGAEGAAGTSGGQQQPEPRPR